MRLWSAQTISQFGSQVTGLALPLVAIITLDASAFEVALLTVVEMAPFILLSLPAGVWVDRLPRKPILVAADLGRAAVLVTVPVAYVLDVLSIEQLYVVGFLAGVGTVFFDVSYQSYLPSLVERSRLVEGNAKLEVSRSSAHIAGPGLAGGLVELVTAPLAILVDAVSFVASALFLVRIRRAEKVERPAGRRPRGSMRRELGEGLRYVFGHPHLRSIAASTATFNFFNSMMSAVLLVYAVRELDLTAGVIGAVFAVGNLGSLAGAVLANRVSGRIGVGPTIVAGAATGAAALLYPVAPDNAAVLFFVVANLVLGFGVQIYNITQVSFRQAITPERIQGRMNSVIRFLVWGVMPLGALGGGALASATDLRTAIWAGALGNSLAFLPVLLSPVRSLHAMPEPDAEPPLPSEATAAGGALGPAQLPAAEDAP